ncbi:MAG: outer membrane lipid asymmetry maintenance protein MlaD [Zoogloea sp.]|uniref:outer membrane lipid asymmetry maintenance protein MlaD n=1 Tax=Zoogloea sp. TaxID=49181 RepID=UPI00260ABB9A|nr:outer membrane lipid asymmetry maintenance protein MlaD [Zoogloea sp.]MDD2990586.1 outer membrane lipid asymmetry maintenance protein MlaD [Zoogloea sp.]
MSRTTMDLWVGVFVAAGIAALLFLALKVGSISGSDIQSPYTLIARFDNIGGLKARAPVKVAGVLVGRVAEIRYDNERFQAEVVFTVDGRYKFPTDTFANILTSGLLGEQYVGLDPGGEDKLLAPGDVIKKTQSAVVLEKLISQFMFNKAAEGDTAPAK